VPSTFKTTLLRVLLMALIGAALLLPVWLVRYPPLLDYPNHLARSFVLAHLNDPAFHFRGFYRAEWGPYPYLGMDLALITLQRILSVEVAGKVFLSLCVLAVPLAAWWFIRQANPGHDALALWGLLLAYNTFFIEGFLNFQLGLAFCFVTMGMWLRYLEHPTKKRWLAVLVLATATYFVHLIAFVLTGFTVLAYTTADRRRLRDVCQAGALFAPGVVLYSLSGIAPSNGTELYFRDWTEKYYDGLTALRHGYSPRLETLTLWVIVICVVLAWVRNSEFRVQRPWVWVFAGLLVLYCALPDEVGNSWDIDVRVVPVLFVMLLVLAKLGQRQRIVAVAVLLLFAIRTADVARNFVAKQAELSGMVQAVRALPRDARLLPLINENNDDDPLQRLYLHFWAYSIIERGAVAPYLFDLRGQTALRTTEEIYIPHRPLKDPLDWYSVKRDYDYAWVYDFPGWTPQLMTVGKIEYAGGNLRLYRLPRAAAEEATR
jgi:hypothetical protein